MTKSSMHPTYQWYQALATVFAETLCGAVEVAEDEFLDERVQESSW